MAEKKKIFNPFDGKDKAEVWKEIRKKSQPISREDALKQIKETSQKQAKTGS